MLSLLILKEMLRVQRDGERNASVAVFMVLNIRMSGCTVSVPRENDGVSVSLEGLCNRLDVPW